MNIIVLNLSKKTSKHNVVKLFEEFGKVELCDLVLDKETGKSKGFGFIDMPNDDEANAAIAGLHGRLVDNNKLRVKVSTRAE